MAAGGTLGFKVSADAPFFVERDLSLDNDCADADEIGPPRWRFSRRRASADSLWSVPARSLLSHQLEEQPDCVDLLFEMMDERLAGRPNPPPPTRETRFAEECFGDFHRVVARHVFRWISALGIKMIGLLDHRGRVAPSARTIQRDF